ncbi:GntR family transcriptional regulator [Nocardioides sp. zg-ZUI104]|uniref:GntR family transcriptional regulator n=1 Tax=Nocardioides faecalis TaxID=2803858 RepID=UPI001BCB27E7|nr:GntR family transcriptional regulator [Nocardioides faecalis]MBS4751933.1 GntR family transcriptional regulator [Nocardioides faecalis]
MKRKTSDAIADELIGRMVGGDLVPGDRIDIDGIARDLDVSRQPVREALIQLERDGLVRMPMHRGAFVAQIDVHTVREGFTLYAVLTALTVRLATAHIDDALIDALQEAYDKAASAATGPEFELAAGDFRRVINHAAAGPHLRSLLRTFNGLVHNVSKLAVQDGLEEERTLLRRELEAFRRHDRAAAVRAAVEHVNATGRRGIARLRRNGIFEPDEGAGTTRSGEAVDEIARALLLLGDLGEDADTDREGT